jgi:hypothetical protein
LHINLFIFSTFSCCSKSSNQPQEDLAKSDYRTNREIKNLGILEHVKEPLKSAQILQKSWQFHEKFLKMWQLFWKFSKRFPWPCCLGLKQKRKMAALVTSLYHHLIIIPSSLYPHVKCVMWPYHSFNINNEYCMINWS